MMAFRIVLLSSSRLLISTKNDDFPFWIGPEKFPPYERRWLGARFNANGFLEFYGDYGEIAVTNRGKTVAVWGEGFSWLGPGNVWVNVQR